MTKKSAADIEKSLQQKREALERSRQVKQKLEQIEPEIREFVLTREIILESYDCSKAEAERLAYTSFCIQAYNKFGLPFTDVSRNAYGSRFVERMQDLNVHFRIRKI